MRKLGSYYIGIIVGILGAFVILLSATLGLSIIFGAILCLIFGCVVACVGYIIGAKEEEECEN